MLNGVIFDLDGTLIDTEKAAAVAVQQSFERWGTAIAPKDAEYITGRTWGSAFDYLFAKYPTSLPRKKAESEILAQYREALEIHLVIVPGAVDAVRALATEFTLGLVSGTFHPDILWALAKLGITDQFKVILGAENYPRSKPAPDGYLKAMSELQIDAAHTVVFEDSQAGIASARDAGAWVVAITGTNHFSQDVSRAHHQIPDLTGINPKWLRDKFLSYP